MGHRQTHADAAELSVGDQHAHDLVIGKANQPTRLAGLQPLPWHQVPDQDPTRSSGRIELPTRNAVSVRHLGFPHAAQVLRVTRKRRGLGDHPRQGTTETVEAITSRTARLASPARLAD